LIGVGNTASNLIADFSYQPEINFFNQVLLAVWKEKRRKESAQKNTDTGQNREFGKKNWTRLDERQLDEIQLDGNAVVSLKEVGLH
jgi:hypothetical protein